MERLPFTPLPPELLYRRCDPEQFDFKTTAELEELGEIIGQPRVVAALHFGIDMRRDGYNLFVLGAPRTGRHSVVRRFIEQKAASEPRASDWCYVNNFEQPQKPKALRLPAGMGIAFKRDVDKLLEELQSAIPAVFESEDYRTRKQVIEEEIKERQEGAFESLRAAAEERGIALVRTPVGVVFAPVKKGEVIGPEEFQKLPEEEQNRVEAEVKALQERLRAIIHQVPIWESEGRQRIRELNREVTNFAVAHLIEALLAKYEELPAVGAYLEAVHRDLVENVQELLTPPDQSLGALMGVAKSEAKGSPLARRYQVNVLVDHSANHGAPVVYEDQPSYQNLVGQVEHVAQLGALVTDFSLIRGGALHRANGGYLLLDAHRVLMQPYAWEGLKRALRSSEIRIESLGQALSLVSTVSLEPDPIPLDLKVVLVGDRLLYYLLCHYDPEFDELFKVAVDFEDEMERTPENTRLYARLIATLGRKEKLMPFDREAVARIIERAARLAGDAQRLSARIGMIADLLREADYWASNAGRKVVAAADVQTAIDAQVNRADRVRERVQDAIQRGTILIDTDGAKVGQVNGLSVIEVGHFAFGRPSRITARVRLGKGEVIDIEREVELGGPIHSKGVLILASLLGARYAIDRPLSLSASLVFEQSYSGVEGDSASSAEFYALLSALANAPIKQALAVTGSVNQHGQVQAIGGVNEKIEGFFDVCKQRGLTGGQGVLIPAANVRELMLRQDVVDAVAAGRFHVYAVETVDQGIELLTGVPAGQRDATGAFPEGSINQRVEKRLTELAEKRAAFAGPAKPEGEAL